MGGRGSYSSGASAAADAEAANRYYIVAGVRHEQLVKLGATDGDIARIYKRYHANRLSGMGKRDSMIAAESDFRNRAKSGTGKSSSTSKRQSSGGKPSGMSKTLYERYKAQGFSESEIAKIWDDTKRTRKRMSSKSSRARPESQVTSTTYENAQRRMQKNVNGWFGRGMG